MGPIAALCLVSMQACDREEHDDFIVGSRDQGFGRLWKATVHLRKSSGHLLKGLGKCVPGSPPPRPRRRIASNRRVRGDRDRIEDPFRVHQTVSL